MGEPVRVLHATSELYPLVKTGGLGDVAAALPAALQRAGLDVRVLVPGYPAVVESMQELSLVRELPHLFHGGDAKLWRARLPGVAVPVYVLDCPWHFHRPGNPYHDAHGHGWPDNPMRFAALSWVASELAMGMDPEFRPQVLHCHDWQTGLGPAYLAHEGPLRARSVVTIHNLGYQGRFDARIFPHLGLPPESWGFGGVEHWGDVGFLKAGLQYADRITAVSRTYADEIQGLPGGMGLEGLLSYRRWDLVGIVNGIDPDIWDPARDPVIPAPFDAEDPSGKAECKRALQERVGLEPRGHEPLFGLVSRLTHEKGIDLVASAVDAIVDRSGQLVVLGTGEPHLEGSLRWLQEVHPGRVAVHIGYDEDLSHLVQAGSDVILVPSRQEPCGLTQLYAQRYGALPLVRRTGGLADTVVNASPANVEAGTATGFVFDDPTVHALAGTIHWVADRWWKDPQGWRRIQQRAMTRDFSWDAAAREYIALYERLL